MTRNISQLKQHSVVLSDLDGLLVNSNNFNQIFIQRTDPAWIDQTIRRVIKSEAHLTKFIKVLITFTISERHPAWANHALTWLIRLLYFPEVQLYLKSNPHIQCILTPLLSYSAEMAGLQDVYTNAALRGVAMEQWVKGQEISGVLRPPDRNYYDVHTDLPSTAYVFIDDSDDEFYLLNQTQKPQRRHASWSITAASTIDDPSDAVNNVETDGEVDLDDVDLIGLGNLTDDDDVDGDEDDGGGGGDDDDANWDGLLDHDSDHGVFDVNETASSDEAAGIQETMENSRSSLFSNQCPEVSRQNSVPLFDDLRSSEDEGSIISGSQEGQDEEADILMWTNQEDATSADSSDSACDDRILLQTNNSHLNAVHESDEENTAINGMEKIFESDRDEFPEQTQVPRRFTRAQMNRSLPSSKSSSNISIKTSPRQTRSRKSL